MKFKHLVLQDIIDKLSSSVMFLNFAVPLRYHSINNNRIIYLQPTHF